MKRSTLLLKTRGLKVNVTLTKSALVWRAVDSLVLPVPRGSGKAIVDATESQSKYVSIAFRVKRLLDADPDLRAKWAPLLANGTIGAEPVLRRILAERAADPASV